MINSSLYRQKLKVRISQAAQAYKDDRPQKEHEAEKMCQNLNANEDVVGKIQNASIVRKQLPEGRNQRMV